MTPRLRSALLIVALTVSASAAQAEVLVSAASSLTDVMTVLAKRFEAETGERVLLNLAASNTLSRQIGAGAKVDVFIAADEVQMDRVANEIIGATRVDLLANRLAVAVSTSIGNPRINGPRDLLATRIRRIAIGDPAAVPAGVYARQYFEKLGLWTALQPKLVPTGSVRLALAAVESGSADAAVVYATDVQSASRAMTAFVVSESSGPRIRYPAAVVNAAPNPVAARRFLAFLQGAEARAVFLAGGFLAISEPPRAIR